MKSVYLDSCALIEAREKDTPEGQAIVNMLAECARDEPPFVTSELALIEVLVDPIRGLVDRPPHAEDAKRRAHHDWYCGNLLPNGLLIRTLPITRAILIQAALVRARVPSIKTPDAIHVATAYRQTCTHFVTGDLERSGKLQRDESWKSFEARFEFVSLSVAALSDLKAELLT